MRWFVFSVVLIASVGCRQSASTFDPFSAYGPATIAPPPTGSAGRDDPYYRRSLSSNANLPAAAPQTVFTSHQNAGQVEVADRRATAEAPVNDNTSNMQWRSPVNDAYATEPFSSEPVGSGRVRPRLPSNRRLGQTVTAPANEPQMLDQRLAGSSNGLNGNYQGLPPTPPANRPVAQVGYQQPVPAQQPAPAQQPVPAGPGGWQTRY